MRCAHRDCPPRFAAHIMRGFQQAPVRHNTWGHIVPALPRMPKTLTEGKVPTHSKD